MTSSWLKTAFLPETVCLTCVRRSESSDFFSSSFLGRTLTDLDRPLELRELGLDWKVYGIGCESRDEEVGVGRSEGSCDGDFDEGVRGL